MTDEQPPTVRVQAPNDLITAVPYLLGFHPHNSLVLLATDHGIVKLAARADLPDDTTVTNAAGAARAVTADVAAAIAHRLDDDTALVMYLIGYGPAARTLPMLAATRITLISAGFNVEETLRVTNGRWINDFCDQGCCPPDGEPIDLTAGTIAATATYAGIVVHADRDTYLAQADPVPAATGPAMAAATTRATRRLEQLTNPTSPAKPEHTPDADPAPSPDEAAHRLYAAGESMIDLALHRVAVGATLDDDDIAWLALLLHTPDIRGAALTYPARVDLLYQLWLEIFRRAEPSTSTAAGALFAITAWRTGDGPLGRAAAHRVLATDPDNVLAQVALGLIDHAAPLAVWHEFLADVKRAEKAGGEQ